MHEHDMFTLASSLADAKNKKELDRVLALSHADMILETPALRSVVRGLSDYEKAIERFFRTFPDYEVLLDGYANKNGMLVCWGTARMTLTGDRFGVTPTGRRATFPVFIQFTFRDGLIASERFFYDLADLCYQSGISTDAVQKKLFG